MCRTLDVSPSLTTDNTSDSTRAYPVGSSQDCQPFAVGKALANLDDLRVRKTGLGVRFTKHLMGNASAFAVHVNNIVSTRAKKQMRGIHAAAIVAMMADAHVVRDGAIVEYITNTVRSMKRYAVKLGFAVAIALDIQSALPFPTIVGAAPVYLLPKADSRRAFGDDGRNPNVMTVKKAIRFTFDGAALHARFLGDVGLLSTTAMTVTVGNVVRGIMGMHKNLQFLCQAQDVSRVAGQLLLGATPVSIAQKGV